jgi:hypothetical protein
MKTWREFFNVVEKLKPITLSEGMFFLMRNPIPPLWENFKNVYGGAYSFRIIKEEAGNAFVEYAIAAMMNMVAKEKGNLVNGLSISPKKTHNIIKIWNTDAAKFKSPDDLHKLLPDMKTEDFLYTPFTSKKM